MLTYFTFLFIFIALPLVGIIAIYVRKYLKNEEEEVKQIRNIMLALTGLIFIALVYTTPWDNFLVENSIWFYDPAKVTGFLIGFVPIEEYTFFIIQTLLIGLFFGLVYLETNLKLEISPMKSNWRIISSTILGGIWFIMLVSFIGDFQPLTYMSLILLWAIPPIIIQLLYGLDILRVWKRELFFSISFYPLFK